MCFTIILVLSCGDKRQIQLNFAFKFKGCLKFLTITSKLCQINQIWTRGIVSLHFWRILFERFGDSWDPFVPWVRKSVFLSNRYNFFAYSKTTRPICTKLSGMVYFHAKQIIPMCLYYSSAPLRIYKNHTKPANFTLVQTHLLFCLRLLPSNLAPWEFMTGSWTMVFTSTHLSLRPSHFSTQGLSPFKPLLNQLNPFLSRVHLSNFRHQSRIWVSILTPDYLLTNRYLKHVKRHISTSVPCATFDHLSPLRQLRQWRRL